MEKIGLVIGRAMVAIPFVLLICWALLTPVHPPDNEIKSIGICIHSDTTVVSEQKGIDFGILIADSTSSYVTYYYTDTLVHQIHKDTIISHGELSDTITDIVTYYHYQ